jgi:hypothetical protein
MNLSRLIRFSRGLLNRAAFYARAATSAKRDGDGDVVPGLLALAQRFKRRALTIYQHATRCAVRVGELAHKYTKDGNAWRAVVMVADAMVWTSPREYGKRQSAQRAALAMVGKLTREYA